MVLNLNMAVVRMIIGPYDFEASNNLGIAPPPTDKEAAPMVFPLSAPKATVPTILPKEMPTVCRMWQMLWKCIV